MKTLRRTRKALIPLVGATSVRVEMRQRISVKHKNKTNKEERENTRFNEVRQFVYVPGVEGERVLIKSINYMIQYQEAITPLYIGHRVPREKKINTSKFGSEINSEVCSDSPRILVLSTAQWDCRQYFDKPNSC